MRIPLLIGVLLLPGCALLGSGKDANTLTIKQTCEVELTQKAGVAGQDEDDFMESVTVNPDCSTTINVKDQVGDDAIKKEAGQED